MDAFNKLGCRAEVEISFLPLPDVKSPYNMGLWGRLRGGENGMLGLEECSELTGQQQ